MTHQVIAFAPPGQHAEVEIQPLSFSTASASGLSPLAKQAVGLTIALRYLAARHREAAPFTGALPKARK
jgi:hypothetical protein